MEEQMARMGDGLTTIQRAHKIVLNNRKNIAITGVTDVISFDLNQILVETDYGMLTIKGQDLHVNKLSVDNGELSVEGRIDNYAYSETNNLQKKGESLMTRLFR